MTNLGEAGRLVGATDRRTGVNVNRRVDFSWRTYNWYLSVLRPKVRRRRRAMYLARGGKPCR